LPRGLPLPAASAYSGVPVRALWRLIADGELVPVRVRGTRRVLLLRETLDELLESSMVRSAERVRRPREGAKGWDSPRVQVSSEPGRGRFLVCLYTVRDERQRF